MPAANATHPPVSEARVGDWIEIQGSPSGAPSRRGQIVEVLGHPGHIHFRVRWDERHESLVYPEAGGALVHRHPEVRP